MLGVQPLLGRSSAPTTTVPDKTGKALLGHGTWMRRYGGEPRRDRPLADAQRPAL